MMESVSFTCGVYSYLSGLSKTGQVTSSVIRVTFAPSSVIHSTLLAVLSSKDKLIQSEIKEINNNLKGDFIVNW